MIKTGLSNGHLYITDEVIAAISKFCIEEHTGIAKVITGFNDKITGIIHKSFSKYGISIKSHDEEITMEIRVVVFFGENIIDLCESLQKSIVEEIKAMTGIKISHIVVKVEKVLMGNE